MEIKRINTYQDSRFSQAVLNQHGCFLVDEIPYEVEIISDHEAVIRGADREVFENIVEEFRFFTPHITVFFDENREIFKEYSPAKVIRVKIADIQPSQFYVDEDKIAAIRTFIHSNEDIIIQVLKHGDRYISLDGHTRLYYAVMMGWSEVRAVLESSGEYIYGFVDEAMIRNIMSPYDLQMLSHQDYLEKWDKFCDNYFAGKD